MKGDSVGGYVIVYDESSISSIAKCLIRGGNQVIMV
jgi:hypothetical protein